MRYFFDDWKKLVVPWQAAPHRLVFSDFDGTLATIVEHPAEAVLDGPTRELLRDLSRKSDLTLALISGRALADLRARVGLPGILYIGNHGLEVDGKSHLWVHPKAQQLRPLIEEVDAKLSQEVATIAGIWVEDKGLSLSVHWRQAARSAAKKAAKLTRSLLNQNYRQSFYAVPGKEVTEIRPLLYWDKGSIVTKLIDEAPRASMSLYVGDDTTDEDAFRAIRSRGIGIRVGKTTRSAASYYLKDQREVQRLLQQLLEV